MTLLLIPPLTQLNTPYPATAYLTGFLRGQGYQTRQGDLGLDMVLTLYSKRGFQRMFDAIESGGFKLTPAFDTMVRNRVIYEEVVDSVISFLQNQTYTLGYRIASGTYLPKGPRFNQLKDIDWFFGHIGVQDKGRYFCTMFIEDIADLIQATVGPHFGFSKYAERVARTAVSFDPIEEALRAETDFLDTILEECLAAYFVEEIPSLVGFTVPFGGNLYGALKAGQWIKNHHPEVKIVMGGGYPNTELRELSDPRVFEYVDYITLDDGEGPMLALHKHLENPQPEPQLKRTYCRLDNKVAFIDNVKGGEFGHGSLPAPVYDGLRFHEYLNVIDIPNPMHRLWNDGRWNKMTIAHGCYWKKCSFCDISLDYIGRYEQTTAKNLVDKMEELIAETGETGFHFVDEAAPPAAMRELAIEILRRGLQVTWWTNIRFEKTFNEDLCRLLAESGCIAVTGGLEVASPRILNLIEKGITIDQVARVCKAFRDAGILVHAYLMYGFPTQTDQETIDSLEVVRQLFEHNLLQSGHWHQFAMTVHSPVGKDPAKYGVVRTGPEFKGFANNDLFHEDPTGADHEKYSDGLKKALYNYMHQNGFDMPLRKFFNFPIPNINVPRNMIERSIQIVLPDPIFTPGYRLMWYRVGVKALKNSASGREMIFTYRRGYTKIELPHSVADFIEQHKERFELFSDEPVAFQEALQQWSDSEKMDPEKLMRQPWYRKVREVLSVVKLHS
jgi:hypothetical protein